MIDFRSHLASIVAVFLALGIGMLVGAQLADEGALAREYGRLIEQIEAGLDRARNDNKQLEMAVLDAQRRLAEESRFVADVLAELLGGQLEGVAVELVADGAEAAEEGRIRVALERAGARLFSSEEGIPVSEGESGAGPRVRVVLRPGEAAVGEGGDWTVAEVATLQGMRELIELLQNEGMRLATAGQEAAP